MLFVVGKNTDSVMLPTTGKTMKKIKVGVKKIDLKSRKTDFRFTWRDKSGGGIRYEDANFRPDSVDPSERVKLLPYTLKQVVELAERDKHKPTGWKYFPRVSYRITFFFSYRRKEDGEPRNKYISQMTYSPYPTRTEISGKGKFLDPNDAVYEKYAEKELKQFWSTFDYEMKKLELPKAEIDKLRKRIESKICSR